MIESFINIDPGELSEKYLNSLTNTITLDLSVQKVFGDFLLWFDAVPVRSTPLPQRYG